MTLFKDLTILQNAFFLYSSPYISPILDNDTKPIHKVQMLRIKRSQKTCTYVIFPACYNCFGFYAAKAPLDAVQHSIPYQQCIATVTIVVYVIMAALVSPPADFWAHIEDLPCIPATQRCCRQILRLAHSFFSVVPLPTLLHELLWLSDNSLLKLTYSR
jgi:hypothetical protein